MRRVEKPWGHELIWADTPHYTAKLLTVNPGHSISLQYHLIKTETWYILEGHPTVEHDRQVKTAQPGDVFHHQPSTVHRITAGQDTTVVLEVSTPHHDSDTIRVEDRYGRTRTKALSDEDAMPRRAHSPVR